MSIRELLAAGPSAESGHALVAWTQELRGRILRGDMMLGILSADEVALVPTALRRASDCGIKEALLDLGHWLAAPPIGEPDLVGARAAYREAIVAGVTGAKLRFVEFVWFYCRETATAEEQTEVHQIAKELSELDDDGRATYLLGLLTCNGFGTQADPKRSTRPSFGGDVQRRHRRALRVVPVPRDGDRSAKGLEGGDGVSPTSGHPGS